MLKSARKKAYNRKVGCYLGLLEIVDLNLYCTIVRSHVGEVLRCVHWSKSCTGKIQSKETETEKDGEESKQCGELAKLLLPVHLPK